MTKTCNLVKLSSLGLLKLSGDKTREFLQGQLTYDISLIDESKSHLAAYCTPQGRVITTMIVCQWQNEFLLIVPAPLLLTTFTHLQKYALFSKVILKEVSDRYMRYGCYGKHAADVLHSHFQEIPMDENAVTTAKEIMMLKIPGTEPRYLTLACSLAEETLQRICTPAPDGENAWQQMSIDSLQPMLSPETTELFTPHDLSLPERGAVSFDKGCYVGQEIIARMEHLGTPKKHLYHATLFSETTPVSNESIYDSSNEMIGSLINAVEVKPHYYKVLAVMYDRAVVNTPITLERVENQIVMS